MNERDEKLELKLRSQEAKKRLKSGYWNNVKAEREKEIASAEVSGRDTQKVKEYYRNKFDKDFSADTGCDDEELYRKAVSLFTLEETETITNPIDRVVDKEELTQLSPTDRQRYILVLSEKLNKMRERYIKEKELSNFIDKNHGRQA